MKNNIFIFIMILFCGCDIHWNESFSKSFIMDYFVIDCDGTHEVFIYDDSAAIVKLPLELYAHCSYGNTLVERHSELSIRYKDNGFNRWVSEGDTKSSWALPFEVLTVTSSVDFDEHHLAGTPLNDLMTIKYYTYRLYIENGYKHTDERAKTSNDYSGDWVTKPLSEFVPEDAIFMAPEYAFELYFVATPTNEQHHHLTLTVGLEGEDPYTVEFDMDFGGSE